MSLPVILRPMAEADIREIHNYLFEIDLELARKFLDQLRKTLERIEYMPEMYGVIWQDIRAVRLKKFRYVVYYVVLEAQVEVLAVLHGSRDESAWKSPI